MKMGRYRLTVTLCILWLIVNSIAVSAADVIDNNPVPVTDIDISMFIKEMEPGEKQLLSVTVLPLDATVKTVTYISSNEAVAEINEIGRITAKTEGTTVISIIAADGISEQFTLTVSGPVSTYVGVSDMDFGDYNKVMTVDETQRITPMILPYNATDSTVRYESANVKIASINGFGKITALAVGTTIIKARVGGIERSFELTVTPKKDTHVKDIDLGDYNSKMEIGETQLLYPAVLPVDAVNPGFSYRSRDEKIAKVNGLGRITAIAEGITEITVESDSIVKTIKLEVIKKKEIKITEMDLGDYPKSMKVGETRVLSPSVRPYEASNRLITYESSEPAVATINSFGRIEALAVGTTQIKIVADKLIQTIQLEVEESDIYEVVDLGLGEYKAEMEKGKNQQLTTIILPEKASNTKVSYSSSNNNVATISSSGEIKAVETGYTYIHIEAGKVTKEFKLSVVTATERIDINQTYLVLKEEEEFQLECQVFPDGADPKIEYKSMDTEVVSVSTEGKIIALKTGEATVIVSNKYMQRAVTVIVNLGLADNEEKLFEAPIPGQDNNELLNTLKKSDNEVHITNDRFHKISKKELKYLYESKKILTIEGTNYQIALNGRDIVNFENELLTNIEFLEEKSEIKFQINNGMNLPGKIAVTVKDTEYKGQSFLYLFNDIKSKYELLSGSFDQGIIYVDTPGEYLITEKKITTLNINYIFIGIIMFVIVTLSGVYVFVKKKHWFW